MIKLLAPGFVLSTVPRRRPPTPSGVAVGLGAVVAVGCGVEVAAGSGVTVLCEVAVAGEPLSASAPSSDDERSVRVLAPTAAARPPMRIAPIIATPTRLRIHAPIST